MARIVIHIHALDLGGAERVCLQWATWLREAGHGVSILVGHQHNAGAFFPLPEGIQLEICPPGRGAFGTASWLRSWLQIHPPDLAIGITTRPALNLLLASQGRPWPVIVAERNYPPARPLPLPWRVLRRWLYPRASLHLVQTERIATWLHEQRLAASVAVVPNPVLWPLPVQEPVVKPEAAVPADRLLVLAVGTKPHQKGFDRLLQAFSLLADDHPGWVLALVGVSPEDPVLGPQLQALGSLRQRVVLPGRVGNLADWYARADLFVLSSRYEGCPNVLLEAMAAGCACLAIDCPTGPREWITSGRNGVLLPEAASCHDLAAGLDGLMGDPGRREALGRAAMGIRTALDPERVRGIVLEQVQVCLEPKVLVLAPTRKSPTETFVRANLQRLPLPQVAYFGDEFGWADGGFWPCPYQLLYGSAILISKVCTRLGLQRLATLPGSLVVWILIRRHRPAVVLAEFGFHAVRVMDGPRWAGVPFVVHFRGSDASAQRRLRPLAERYRRLMGSAAALLAKSEPMKQVLVGLGARDDQVTVTPSGADPDRFHGSSPAAMPPVVLFVGRLIPKKAPGDAIAAFARALRSAPAPLAKTMELWIVGDGPLRSQLEEQCRTLGLTDKVRFCGLESPDQVAQRMRHSRCLLLPSRTAPDGDAEGCPVVVLEAQLSGLPVVSTFHAGIPEVVVNQFTGLLTPEGDVEALGEALLALCEQPELASRLGRNGQERVAGQFTINHHVNTVAAVLRRQALNLHSTP